MPNEGSVDQSEPSNFELPNHGAIREENWAEYEAQGFRPITNVDSDRLPLHLRVAQGHYGTAHVYTGDAYDHETGRPLRHKPGTGLYVDADGLIIGAENMRAARERNRQDDARQAQSEGGPAVN